MQRIKINRDIFWNVLNRHNQVETNKKLCELCAYII